MLLRAAIAVKIELQKYKSRKKRISVDLVFGTNKKLMEYNVSNLFFQDGK